MNWQNIFRNKQSNIWPVIEPSHDNLINDAAEMVLNHQFEYNDQLVTYGDHINWFDNPIDDSEWLWTLNRMPHWKTLLQGYIETTNESYAQEYNDEVLDWIIRNPAPAFRLTRVPAWRNLEAGIRCSSVWPETLYGFLASPSFQAHTIQLMLASLWSHAEHIYKFPSGMRFVNNWVIIESSGLAVVGMGFPEFINSEKWSAEGLSRLSEQLAKQVYPDGVQHELASGYHLSCLSSFCTAYEIAKKNNVQIPDSYSTTLEKMFDYLLYAATPSRELPPTNDSFRSNIVTWLKKGAALFNRPDMLFVAENGQEGTMPEKTSYHFPHAGQSIMRSNWSKNALYLFFDAGPYGVSHQHEDKLHIDVSAYGRDFITDAGKGSYVPDKWRSYFTSTAAHNTILIDGLGQNRNDKKETHRYNTNDNYWFTGDSVDFAYGFYNDGYGPQNINVEHKRFIFFKKNEYWLVLDLLDGLQSQKFDVLYHFLPCDFDIDPDNKMISTTFSDGKNILLCSQGTVPLETSIIKGQEGPEQGWISTETEKRLEAPTVVFSGESQLPVLVATLIKPFQGNMDANVNITISRSPEYQAAVIIHADWGEDWWVVNLKNENKITIGVVDEKAKFGFWRIVNENIVQEILKDF